MAKMQNSGKSIKVGIQIWVNPDKLVQTYKTFLKFPKLKTNHFYANWLQPKLWHKISHLPWSYCLSLKRVEKTNIRIGTLSVNLNCSVRFKSTTVRTQVVGFITEIQIAMKEIKIAEESTKRLHSFECLHVLR